MAQRGVSPQNAASVKDGAGVDGCRRLMDESSKVRWRSERERERSAYVKQTLNLPSGVQSLLFMRCLGGD